MLACLCSGSSWTVRGYPQKVWKREGGVPSSRGKTGLKGPERRRATAQPQRTTWEGLQEWLQDAIRKLLPGGPGGGGDGAAGPGEVPAADSRGRAGRVSERLGEALEAAGTRGDRDPPRPRCGAWRK